MNIQQILKSGARSDDPTCNVPGSDGCQSIIILIDGTPYAMKVARTVWVGGKCGDNIKALPIDIKYAMCMATLSTTLSKGILKTLYS